MQPGGVYYGFKVGGKKETIVINVPTGPYNHDEPNEYKVEKPTIVTAPLSGTERTAE